MNSPLIKAERSFKRVSHKGRESLVQVANYSVDDIGNTVLSPVPEHKRPTFSDGKSLEIANLVYGSMPETLSQVQLFDQQEAAEHITTTVVRRFGDLEKQKDEIKKKFENNPNT